MGVVGVFAIEHQCTGKHPYRLKRDAKGAAKRAASRAGELMHSRRLMHAYRCPHCDQWHIGHRPPRRSDAKASA